MSRYRHREVPFWIRVRGTSVSLILIAGVMGLLYGCASTGRRVERFKPAPRDGIAHERELPPHPQVGKPRRAYSPLVVPDPYPPEVVAEINELKGKYPEVFQRGLNRAVYYETEIRRMLREEGMPEDLVWLAMVESMFQLTAQSPAGARGMWQFIPGTARNYGLRVDRYVDERNDWRKSTRAAIAYLRDLHDGFDGDWALAVSAYNMGENGLKRLIGRAGGQRDFWKLIYTPPVCDQMRMETKKYYPRLLAYIIVNRNPGEHGFTKGAPAPLPPTEEVPVPGGYALRDLAVAMNLSPDALEAHNPELIRKVTPPGESWNLRVPRGMRETLLVALRQVRPGKDVSAYDVADASSSGYYTVRKGDTLHKIATRFNTSADAVAKANKISKNTILRVGQRLRIPGQVGGGTSRVTEMVEAVRTAQAAREAAAEIQAAPAPSRPVTHTVAKGETLSGIARRYGTSVNRLIAWNGLNAKSTIYPGQKLKVGEEQQKTDRAAAGTDSGTGSQIHVVQAGETASAIAKQYGVSLDRLLEANRLKRDSVLRVGDRLAIPGFAKAQVARNVNPEAEPQPRPSARNQQAAAADSGKSAALYSVKRGDTLSSIAAAHGTTVAALCALNGIDARGTIREGQKLKVPASGSPSEKSAAGGSAAASTSGKKIQHKVEPGQNPTLIARKYNVTLKELFAWNGWDSPPVLKVGDAVTVYVCE